MSDEGQKAFAAIVSKCWNDAAFKRRFLSDPKAVLSEHKIEVPANLNVKVVENTDTEMYITLPSRPSEQLSDESLDNVAGGLTFRAVKLTPFRQAFTSTQSGGSGSTCYKDCIPW